jgi:hypothetical protein
MMRIKYGGSFKFAKISSFAAWETEDELYWTSSVLRT